VPLLAAVAAGAFTIATGVGALAGLKIVLVAAVAAGTAYTVAWGLFEASLERNANSLNGIEMKNGAFPGEIWPDVNVALIGDTAGWSPAPTTAPAPHGADARYQ
jgi:hypothetical protein